MPKVIDAIMFSGELDMLELRLNELNGVVDHFVIVEATEPHGAAGRREVTDPDRLKAVIGPFKDKVHYEVITLDPPYTDRESGWRRENYHRASLMAPVLQWSASPQDVILVSDADEIPRADVIKNLVPWLVSSGQLAYFGLDMYLYKRHYVQRWDHIPAEKQFAVTVTRGGEPFPAIKPERVTYVTEQVGYWRKANEIHRWFVNNVQDGEDNCQPFPVDAEELRKLLATVTAVLDRKEKPEEALPTQSGFFFGGTDYDDYYWEDLARTKLLLEGILAEPDADKADYIYRASW